MFVAFSTALWDHVSHFIYRYESVPSTIVRGGHTLSLSLRAFALLLIYPCIDCGNWFGGLLPYQPPIQLTEQSIMICHASSQKNQRYQVCSPPSTILGLIATVCGPLVSCLTFLNYWFYVFATFWRLKHVFQRPERERLRNGNEINWKSA